jgi:hypothetical protein
MMNKSWLPVLIVAAVSSTNAFAHHDRDDGDHDRHSYRNPPTRVVIYQEPAVVYQAPPPVAYEPPRIVYRERIVYRDRPVYIDQPETPYYVRQASYPVYDENRVVGNAIGAITGGVLGHQIGRGNGRVAATAIGAVVGTLVGGHLADTYR